MKDGKAGALAAVVAVILGGAPSAGLAAEPAGFVLTKGKVYTVNKEQPWAEAVVVKGKEIVYVGDNAGAAKLKGEGMEEIDLK